MSSHVSWEMMNDYLDGLMSPDAGAQVELHTGECESCRVRLAELERAVREVGSLAREESPPAEAWAAIKSEIERRKVVQLPVTDNQVTVLRNDARRRRFLALAASLVLVASSSAITALVLKRGDVTGETVATAPPPAVAVPTALHDVERGYFDSLRELTEALDAARPHLSPATVVIVERNLQLIDAAIEESREVLKRDPGNRVLQEVLAGTYRQKLELLRRAAQLAAS